jgi:soluble lytic murein transglycosylase-like protein
MCIFAASAALAQTTAQTAAPTTPPATPPAAPPTAAALFRASIDKQRASVRKQAQATGAKLIPWTPSPFFDGPEPACDAIAADLAAPMIEASAKANQLPETLVRAVIEQESAYRPCAVSRKGAQGLMQIMPETAAELNVNDVFDPKENIAAGAKYLKQLLNKYKGDNKLALAAYNAGPAAVDAANGVPDIQETKDYVDAILKKLK